MADGRSQRLRRLHPCALQRDAAARHRRPPWSGGAWKCVSRSARSRGRRDACRGRGAGPATRRSTSPRYSPPGSSSPPLSNRYVTWREPLLRSATLPRNHDEAHDVSSHLNHSPCQHLGRFQKPQFGFGASSSPRKAPPVGAMITLTSCAGAPDSLRTMCPRASSTNPFGADTRCGVQVGSSYR